MERIQFFLFITEIVWIIIVFFFTREQYFPDMILLQRQGTSVLYNLILDVVWDREDEMESSSLSGSHLEASSSLRRRHILPAAMAGNAHISLLCKWHIIASQPWQWEKAARTCGLSPAHPSEAQTVTADRAHFVIAACLPAARPPIKIVTQILWILCLAKEK